MARQYQHEKAARKRAGGIMNLQKHHVIVVGIAIVVAVALAANYYLW